VVGVSVAMGAGVARKGVGAGEIVGDRVAGEVSHVSGRETMPSLASLHSSSALQQPLIPYARVPL